MSYLRQLDLCNPAALTDVVSIVGLGGIGSPTALILAKMGCQALRLYDFDTVEPHNIPCQLYGPNSVGENKAHALATILDGLAGIDGRMTATARAIDAENPLDVSPIVVSAVDSMAGRKLLWEQVKASPVSRLFIDSRMGAEMGRLLAVNLLDSKHAPWYDETLYSDSEALQEPCTARAIAYTGFALGAQIAHLIKRYALRQEIPFDSLIDFRSMTWTNDNRPLTTAA
jgi:hypothetical protein